MTGFEFMKHMYIFFIKKNILYIAGSDEIILYSVHTTKIMNLV